MTAKVTTVIGVDRRGYDEEGFQVRDPSDSSFLDTPSEFDPDIYNAFWGWYSKHGGRYPDFVDSHWGYFPDKDSRSQRIKHVAYYHRRIKEVLDSSSEELIDLQKSVGRGNSGSETTCKA